MVDDEVDFLETLVKRLNKRGVNSKGVVSGEEALAALKELPYDVVLLDIKMPGGMDGIETLREIKKTFPLTEVLLLTGHASVETSIEGMKLGAFDYLLKPIKLEDLFAKLVQAFEKKDTEDQKSAGHPDQETAALLVIPDRNVLAQAGPAARVRPFFRPSPPKPQALNCPLDAGRRPADSPAGGSLYRL